MKKEEEEEEEEIVGRERKGRLNLVRGENMDRDWNEA